MRRRIAKIVVALGCVIAITPLVVIVTLATMDLGGAFLAALVGLTVFSLVLMWAIDELNL